MLFSGTGFLTGEKHFKEWPIQKTNSLPPLKIVAQQPTKNFPAWEKYMRYALRWKIGTLRSDNGDVHENVAEKQTSHHFKLFRDYPNSPCYLKEGDFGRSWRERNALKFRQRW